MNIEVWHRVENDHYEWSLYDGTDGIEHYDGQADSLGEAFEQIVAHRIMIGLEYAEDVKTGTTALEDHRNSGEPTISLDQVIAATKSVDVEALVAKHFNTLEETTSTIVFAIKESRYGWLTAQQIAKRWGLDLGMVKHILETDSQFLHADAMNERFYTTKERYFRWRNIIHIIGDFLTQKITITENK
jgi:hypothetical protein